MKQNPQLESSSDSPGAGLQASTLLEKLYLYETTQFKLRAIGYGLIAVVTFAYAVLSAEVWGRPEKNVVYECLALAAILSFLVPVLQIKLLSTRVRLRWPERLRAAVRDFTDIDNTEWDWAKGGVTFLIVMVVVGSFGAVITSAVVDIWHTIPTLIK